LTIGRTPSLTGVFAKATNPVRAFLFEQLTAETAKRLNEPIHAVLAAGPR